MEPLHTFARLSLPSRGAEPRAGGARARRLLAPRRRAPRSRPAELDRDRRPPRGHRVLPVAAGGGDAGAAGVAGDQVALSASPLARGWPAPRFEGTQASLVVVEPGEILHAPAGDCRYETIDPLGDADHRVFHALEVPRMCLENFDAVTQNVGYLTEQHVGLALPLLESIKTARGQID